MKAVARVAAIDREIGVVLEIPDGKESIKQAVMPRGWLSLQPGDHFLVEFEKQYTDGFSSVNLKCLYKCDDDGKPIYGTMTAEQIEEAPVLVVTEKSPRGIRYKMPNPWRKTMISEFVKPSGWEKVLPGEVLEAIVYDNTFQLCPIR